MSQHCTSSNAWQIRVSLIRIMKSYIAKYTLPWLHLHISKEMAMIYESHTQIILDNSDKSHPKLYLGSSSWLCYSLIMYYRMTKLFLLMLLITLQSNSTDLTHITRERIDLIKIYMHYMSWICTCELCSVKISTAKSNLMPRITIVRDRGNTSNGINDLPNGDEWLARAFRVYLLVNVIKSAYWTCGGY